jgi:hypothetical protein
MFLLEINREKSPSPTSGANSIGENATFGISDTFPTHETPKSSEADVKWPKRIKHRNKVLAKIYRPCEGRVSYRVAWHAAGKRQMKSFPTYAGKGGAKEYADSLVVELAKGSQVALLTPRQAQEALNIRDMLTAYQEESGRRISAQEAVSSFIAASKLLPASASLIEGARVYARTLGCVKAKPIAEGRFAP